MAVWAVLTVLFLANSPFENAEASPTPKVATGWITAVAPVLFFTATNNEELVAADISTAFVPPAAG